MKAVVYKEPYSVAVEEVDKLRDRGAHRRRRPDHHGRQSAVPTCTCTRGAPAPHPAWCSGTRTWASSRGGRLGRRGHPPGRPGGGCRSTWRAGSARTAWRGKTGFCLTVNPVAAARTGYVPMGPYPGGQAEYLRVPFADFNCLKLPPGERARGRLRAARRHLPPATTGHRTGAGRGTGETGVRVRRQDRWGLMAAYSALLRGASRVFVVDRVPSRLALAGGSARH